MDFQELLLSYYSMELKYQMHALTHVVFHYEGRKGESCYISSSLCLVN